MTTPTIAEVAGKLSDAQRRFLCRLVDHGTTRAQYADMRTVKALDRLGLTGAGQDRATYEETVFPTALAHKVREYLSQPLQGTGG